MNSRFLKFLPCAVLIATTLAHAQKPALVQNIDERGRVPFQQEVSESCVDGASFCRVDINVPSGQRLVVTHISATQTTSVAPSSGIYAVLENGNALPVATTPPANGIDAYVSSQPRYALPLTLVGSSNAQGGQTLILDRDLTYFVNGGSTIALVVSTTPVQLTALHGSSLIFAVCGYLIPLSSVATN